MSVDSRPGPSAVPGLASAAGGPLADRLQALLAQAVDEQLAERRLIAEALAELGGRIEYTAGQAREASADLTGAVSEGLSGHSATVGRLADAVRELPAALAELRGELARLADRVGLVPTAAQNAAAVAPQVADRLAAVIEPAVAEAVRRHVEPLLSRALSALPGGSEAYDDGNGLTAGDAPEQPVRSWDQVDAPGKGGSGWGREPERSGDTDDRDEAAGRPEQEAGGDGARPARRRWWSLVDG